MVELRKQGVMVDYVHVGMQCGCTHNLANTSTTAIVPYFPTGTMEREETEGQVATAKVLPG